MGTTPPSLSIRLMKCVCVARCLTASDPTFRASSIGTMLSSRRMNLRGFLMMFSNGIMQSPMASTHVGSTVLTKTSFFWP